MARTPKNIIQHQIHAHVRPQSETYPRLFDTTLPDNHINSKNSDFHCYIGDTEAKSIWKFLQRSAASFLNSHGFRFGIDYEIGARVLSDTVDKNEGNTQPVPKLIISNQNRFQYTEARLNKKKKWQVIIPLAILGKLVHLKMLVTKILFGLGAIQVILIGGGVLLYYYLKHNTLCKIEPHLIQSHSHVADVPMSSGTN